MKNLISILGIYAITVGLVACGGGGSFDEPTPIPPSSSIESATADGGELEDATIKATSPIVVTLTEAIDPNFTVICNGSAIDLATSMSGFVLTLSPADGEWPQLASCILQENEPVTTSLTTKAVLAEIPFSVGCGLKQPLFTIPEALSTCWDPNIVGFSLEDYGIMDGMLMLDASAPSSLVISPGFVQDKMAFTYKKVRGSSFTVTVAIAEAIFELGGTNRGEQILAGLVFTDDIDNFRQLPLTEKYDALIVGYQWVIDENGEEQHQCAAYSQTASEEEGALSCESLPLLKMTYDNGTASAHISLDDGESWQLLADPLISDGPAGAVDGVLVLGVFATHPDSEARVYFEDLDVVGDIELRD